MAITSAHKREWNKLHRTILAAVARMNAIAIETERDYRAEFHFIPHRTRTWQPELLPDDGGENDEGQYRRINGSRIGDEHMESDK